MTYYSKNYQNLPKKPIKSFMDLEVYQKALEANVFVCRSIAEVALSSDKSVPKKQKGLQPKASAISETERLIITTMVNCACSVPHLIAEAHSYRFGSQTTCLALLEKVMLYCNKMAVYIEQCRDICQILLEHEQYEELIKKYMCIRRKVLNLQRAWKKYMRPAGEVARG